MNYFPFVPIEYNNDIKTIEKFKYEALAALEVKKSLS